MGHRREIKGFLQLWGQADSETAALEDKQSILDLGTQGTAPQD
jgi:hypothetical protein